MVATFLNRGTITDSSGTTIAISNSVSAIGRCRNTANDPSETTKVRRRFSSNNGPRM